MIFLTPLALALSALAIPIILLYVLKLRRQEYAVSSTMLWQRALDDVQANAPWQRLRPSMLLALQLLALAVLVLTLAAPAYSHTHTYAGDVIVIVDESYGMQARDVLPSRFAVAVSRARSLAADLSGGAVMSVIGMGAQPQLKIAESSDRGAINTALDSLQVGGSAPNVLAALSLASSLARSGQTTQAIILTSRESGISSLPLQVRFPVDVVRIGGPLHDLGITDASAARAGSHVQAIVRVGNFGYRTAQSDLDLWVNGVLADVRPLSVAPGKQQTLFWSDLPPQSSVIRAQVVAADNVVADKSAWMVVAPQVARHILLVSNGDYFLQTALGLDPSIALTTESPRRYRPADTAGADLVIFDGWLPARLPALPTLVVAPPGGRSGPLQVGPHLIAGPAVDAPALPTSGPGTVLQYADLSDVHVAVTRRVSLPGWMQPLVVANGLTLIAAGDSGSTRLGVIAFQLRDSDWPLRVSFPVVMESMVRYLAPGTTGGVTTIATGDPVPIWAPAAAGTIQITRPDGSAVVLHAPFTPFADTSEAGIYRVREAHGPGTVFAANFFPARPAPALGPSVLHLGSNTIGTRGHAVAHVSIAWIFGVLGLALLSLEWWYAFRR